MARFERSVRACEWEENVVTCPSLVGGRPVRAKQHILRGFIKRLAAAAALTLAGLAVALAQSPSPPAVIEQLHGRLIEVMQNAGELDYEGRYLQLEPILRQSYDFLFMTRVAVGPDWADLDQAQRDRLAELFAAMSIASYAARFDGYGGEHFETFGQEPAPRDTVLVQTRLVRPGDQPVALNYVLKESEGGWRIIDVLLESKFSELARQRSEFAAVLRDGGPSDLVATLERKIAELAAEG
jgi:phospholipid transport system substrate-binding protein